QINPSHTGPRPRIQLNHGNNDETINFNNFREAIEQWTNVLGLDATPTSTDSGFQGTAKPSSGSPPVTYDRQFWKDDCGYTVLEAWEARNEKHGMGYEAEAILQWFGLDAVREQDPWDAACGGMGDTDPDPGSGGMDTDAGGPTGTDATGTDTGATGTDTGATGTATGAT